LTQVMFERLRDETVTPEQEEVWSTGINGFTGHMGSSLGNTLSEIYQNHIDYANQFLEEPPSPEAVLAALLALVEAGLYKMYVE